MGYNTWKSLPNELPNRTNIVISKNHYDDLAIFFVNVYRSYEDFLDAYSLMNDYGRVFIIGGSTLYRHVMENYERTTDYIYQTFIHDVYPKIETLQILMADDSVFMILTSISKHNIRVPL